VPGLVVLYGGVMQKRWSVNSMMMAFVAFALVLIVWVLYGFKIGLRSPLSHLRGGHRVSQHHVGNPGSVLGTAAEQSQGARFRE